jgi:phage-related minor tail protein
MERLGIVVAVDGTLEASNGLKLTGQAVQQLGAELGNLNKATTDSGQTINTVANNWRKNMDGVGATMRKAVDDSQALSEATQQIVDRYDPLGAKLRMVNADLAAFRAAMGNSSSDTAIKTFAALEEELAKTHRQMQVLATSSGQVFDRGTLSAKQYQFALRGVPAQMTDIVTSLQAGQAPFTVMLQQGGQLKDMFGGVGNAARALGDYVVTMFTPLTVGLGAAAVAMGGLGYAMVEGAKQEKALNDSLLLTGNYAGLTAGQLDMMASSLARGIGGSASSSREVLASLTATGKFTTASLKEAGEATQLVARFSGQTNEQVVKQFASMADGAAAWAAKTNASYHFLTFAQYKHIEQLEKQGRLQDAMRESSEALSAHIGGKLTTNLGTLEKAWKGVGNWASDAWSKMLGVGKIETTEQKISSVTERLNYLATQKNSKGWTADQKAQAIAAMEGERATLESDLRQERRLVAQSSERDQRQAQLIADDRKKQKGGRAAPIDREPELQRRLIAENAGLSPSFAGDWDRLTEVYKKNGLSLEWLTDAQEKLLAKQPAMRAAAQEKAALARTETQLQESLLRINEQYLTSLERNNEAVEKTNKGLLEQTQQAGLTKEQIGYLKAARIDDTIAQEKANLATAEGSNAEERKLTLMREHIKLLEEERGLQAGLTAKTALVDAEKVQADASKKFGETIHTDLKNGLIRGFEAGKSPSQALADTLGAMVKQRLASAFADSILNSFKPLMDQVLAQIKIPGAGASGGGGGILDSVVKFFGGGGSGAAPAAGAFEAAGEFAGVGLFHSGGIAGGSAPSSRAVPTTLFSGAPRHHTGFGGLKSNERPIIVEDSEGIFTKDQMANMQPKGGAAPTINIYTPPGMKSETKQTKNAGGGFNVDVMISAVEDALADRVGSGSGALYGAMSDRFGLRTQVA